MSSIVVLAQDVREKVDAAELTSAIHAVPAARP
jgi:hypothetical protein